ncbi:hypothetical protein B0H16DRAFT_1720457 [Mycena metata]|uniref:Uncharacterized protein n=1 Tax=Mycena metata TaxID=1033252 RepID=A0AAD7NFA9_9AGAR|nr:hypothetical protein B0H16DRAFT_1720457 [Mycena metata]
MSTPTIDQPGRADTSESWRSTPPHMQSGGSTPFVSAVADDPDKPGDMATDKTDSVTSGERTESPSALSGLTVSVRVDARGLLYFREDSTGLRVEVYDSAGQPIYAGGFPHSNARSTPVDTKQSTTVSDETDITPDSGTEVPTSVDTPEVIIASLLNDVDPNTLSDTQKSLLHSVQGSLSTSRSRLLSTTAIVLDQRKKSQSHREELVWFKEDTAERFTELGDASDNDHLALEKCIQDNIQLLSELGESETAITQLIKKIGVPGI